MSHKQKIVINIIGIFTIITAVTTIFQITHKVEQTSKKLTPTQSYAHSASSIINACDSGTYQDTYISCAEIESDPRKPHCLNKSYLAGCYKMEGNELVLHWELKFNDLEALKLQSGERALENYFDKFQTIPAEDGTTLPYRGWPRETSFGIATDFNGDGIIQCKNFNDPAEPQYEMISTLFKSGSLLGSCRSIINGSNCNSGNPHCHGTLRDCQFATYGEDGTKRVTCNPEGYYDYVNEFRINLDDYENGLQPIYLFYEQKVPNGLLCDTLVKDGCIDAAVANNTKGEEYTATLVFYPPGLTKGETKLITAPKPGPNPNVCNPNAVDMTVSQANGQITFEISGDGFGNDYTIDNWSGGIECDDYSPLDINPISQSLWIGKKTCSIIAAGDHQWTHYWKNTENGDLCLKTIDYTIANPPTNTPIPGTPTPWMEVFSNKVNDWKLVEMQRYSTLNPPASGYYINSQHDSRGIGFSAPVFDQNSDYEYSGFRVARENNNVEYSPEEEWNMILYDNYYHFVRPKSEWKTGKKRIQLTLISHTPVPTLTPVIGTPTPYLEVNSNKATHLQTVELKEETIQGPPYRIFATNISGASRFADSFLLPAYQFDDTYLYTGFRVEKDDDLDYVSEVPWEFLDFGGYNYFVVRKSDWLTGKKSINLIYDNITPTPTPRQTEPMFEVISNESRAFGLVEADYQSTLVSTTYDLNRAPMRYSGSSFSSVIMDTSNAYNYTGFYIGKGRDYWLDYEPKDEWRRIEGVNYHTFIAKKEPWPEDKRRIELIFATLTPTPTGGTPLLEFGTPTPGDSGCSKFDLYIDDKIDISDFVIFMSDYGMNEVCANNHSRSDFYEDCKVDIQDFILFAKAHKIYNEGMLPDYPQETCWDGS